MLAFDATVTSASDVDPPLDCALYARDSYHVHEQRFEADDLAALHEFWGGALRSAVDAAVPLVEPLMVTLEQSAPYQDHAAHLRTSA